MSATAPIAIFIYNRPFHLYSMLAGLRKCEGFDSSPIIVFGDGPSDPDELVDVEAARAVARQMLGPRADYRFSSVNKGLARSVIDGIGAVVAEYGRVIVIEDDLALAPNFLSYVNEALDRYADDESVYQISGHAFNVPEFEHATSALILPWTTTWGWGTWRRAWQHFDPASSGSDALATVPALRRRFNLDGAYDYASMLESQIRGLTDSWGIRWYWSVFARNGLTVYPPQSLVRNIGMDGSGSHGRGFFRSFDMKPAEFRVRPIEFPEARVDPATFAAVRSAVLRQNGGMAGQLVDQLKQIARRVRRLRRVI
jgi:hypothetical protein